MAKVNYQHPIEEIKGALAPRGIINRRKVYQDDRGTIIHHGTPEAYAVCHPRDFKKTPPQGAELQHHLRWKQACAQTFTDLHDEEKLKDWQNRFNAHLKRATADTPIDPKTGKRKRYYRLDAFVRAVIYAQLKAQDTQQ